MTLRHGATREMRRRRELRPHGGRMLDLKFRLHGGCSSGVERRIVDPEVAGSKPVTHPTLTFSRPETRRPASTLIGLMDDLVITKLIDMFDVWHVQGAHRFQR